MTYSRARWAIPLCIAMTCAPVLAQTPKQTPKKPPAKTAPKAAPAKKAEPPKPEPPPPDLTVTNSYVVGDKTTRGTVLMHGQRQRVAGEGLLASIQMCDQHRSVQLNSTTRVYLESPDPTPPSDPVPVPGEKRKGGRVTYTTAVVDTGETKHMFAFTAHHLKT